MEMDSTAVKSITAEDTFVRLVNDILCITKNHPCDKRLLYLNLQSLNQLNYVYMVVEDETIVTSLLGKLSSSIHPRDDPLVREFFRFLENLVKCNFIMADCTYFTCKQWITKGFRHTQSKSLELFLAFQSLLQITSFDTILQDLDYMLQDNSFIIKNVYPRNKNATSTYFLALGCLKIVLQKNEKSKSKIKSEYLEKMCNIVFNSLNEIQYKKTDDVNFNKIVLTSIKMLQFLLNEKNEFDRTDMIGKILGVVQAYLFYGITGYSYVKSQIVQPSILDIPEVPYKIETKGYFGKKGFRKCKRSTTKLEDRETGFIDVNIMPSSESETSDTETKSAAMLKPQVRYEIIQLLWMIVDTTSHRDFFNYWPQLVVSNSIINKRTLAKYILLETREKNRQVALFVFYNILIGGRIFLLHAETVEQLSFITIFGMLGSVVEELHNTLSLLLSSEKSNTVLIQTLKCTAVLAKATPYTKLKTGLVTKLVRHCQAFLFHKDVCVKVAALAVFEALTLSNFISSEVMTILSKPVKNRVKSIVDAPKENEAEEHFFELEKTDENRLENDANSECEQKDSDFVDMFDDGFEEIVDEIDINNVDLTVNEENVAPQVKISALVEYCLFNLSLAANEQIKVQSLKLLGNLAFNVSSLIIPFLDRIVPKLIKISSTETECIVATHACRVVENISRYLYKSKPDLAPKFWTIAFDDILSLLQHYNPSIREIACDCLGNLTKEILECRNKTIKVISGLLGATKDESSNVKAESIRALGALVDTPNLEEDTNFLMDVIEITCAAYDDRCQPVRFKAIWTLAAVFDCLIRREKNPEVEPIPLKIALPQAYIVSLKACKDGDKVSSNAVRIIGSILYLCKNKEVISDTASGLEALLDCIKNSTDSKVRWNACRALGNALNGEPNEVLPPLWEEQVFPILCDLLYNTRNFKIRINAAVALTSSKSFGKYLVNIWKSVMLGFENSKHVPHYTEYVHQDGLVVQFCLLLCHLACFIDVNDLESLWFEIENHYDDALQYMQNFHDNVLPEKAVVLMKAKTYLTGLKQQCTKSSDQHIVVKLLGFFEKNERFVAVDASSTPN
ncbi:hypothetical protein TKK_0014206 [Trichogramma kaykai]|uniref:HEAT repeat-containing protein 6 n=1 Tax=Trichogramma kaykai TaxID=54128 RepID=A0ABD2WEZ8_9HYME